MEVFPQADFQSCNNTLYRHIESLSILRKFTTYSFYSRLIVYRHWPNVPAIEVFLSRVEKDLFAKSTAKEVSDNLSGEERTALKKFRSTPFEEQDLIVRLQDTSNNFVFLDNKLNADKVKELMERGCFKNVGYDPSPETVLEIEQWINKWQPMGLSLWVWIKFITNTNNTHPGINNLLIKTHKADNPARVITSGCGTPTENLSLFV